MCARRRQSHVPGVVFFTMTVLRGFYIPTSGGLFLSAAHQHGDLAARAPGPDFCGVCAPGLEDMQGLVSLGSPATTEARRTRHAEGHCQATAQGHWILGGGQGDKGKTGVTGKRAWPTPLPAQARTATRADSAAAVALHAQPSPSLGTPCSGRAVPRRSVGFSGIPVRE